MRRIWIVLAAVFLVTSLAFNVAVVTVSSAAALASTAVNALTGVQTVYGTLNDRVSESDARVRNLNDEATRLLAEIDDLEDSLAKSEASASRLSALIVDKDAQLASLTDDFVSAEARIQNLEGELAGARERAGRLSTELRAAGDRLEGAEADLSATTQKATALEAQLDAQAVKQGRLIAQLDAKSIEVDELGDELAAVRRMAVVSYRGAAMTGRAAVLETTSRIKSRTTTAAARNLSAVAAEAIPFFGIAAMLAVTGYDLHDACETVKDLHALEVALDPSLENSDENYEACGMEVPTRKEVWDGVLQNTDAAWAAAGEFLPDLPELPDAASLIAWVRVPSFPDFGKWRE